MATEQVLIVIDAQKGFLDPSWGRSNNPECENNIRSLLDHWRANEWPIVLVRHDSVSPNSPLRPNQVGNEFQDGVDGPHDLLISKTVNSAFYGEPNLEKWLRDKGHSKLAICGITTNHCCETTARMAGNLGFDVDFIIDATRTFDFTDLNGEVVSASEMARITATNLNGEFARIRFTHDMLLV